MPEEELRQAHEQVQRAVEELQRVMGLIQKGLALPVEKAGALQLASDVAKQLPDQLLARRAQKLSRATLWTKQTSDGFVADDEADQLKPWIDLLRESLEPILQVEAPGSGSVRFAKGEPASNVLRLVGLLGGSSIEAVFDPYLDTSGLRRLLSLSKHGVKFSEDLRCLSSGKADDADMVFVQDLFTELQTRGELRVTGSRSDHRRFLLLSDGKVLILGNSLNDFDKDEAAHLESGQRDRTFFDVQWEKSVSVETRIRVKRTVPKEQPAVDFFGGTFSHTGGPSGREIISRLSNHGGAPAMNVSVSIESDSGPPETLVSLGVIPTIKSSGETSSEIHFRYSDLNIGSTLLASPRIVFSSWDTRGNRFQSSRTLVQELRADGKYDLKAGDRFSTRWVDEQSSWSGIRRVEGRP